MEPKLFRFSSYPDPLWVQVSLCANPDCECGDVFVDLVEHDEARPYGQGRVILSLQIDTDTWREARSRPRPESLGGLAQEFLREYPAAERAACRELIAEKRRVARRLREYRIDPRTVAGGKLLAFGDIVSEGGSLSAGGQWVALRLQHGGVDYLVDDLYCPNPDCHCEDVHLAFFRCTLPSQGGGVVRIKEGFRVTMSLDGNIRSVECFRMNRSDASAVVKAWRDSPAFAHDLEDFQWRYGKIKEIAERGGPRPGRLRVSEDQPTTPAEGLSPPADRLARSPRVGRNEPCTCGSGKKYKKCCGKTPG